MAISNEMIRRELEWTRNELANRLHRIRHDLAHSGKPLSADAPDRAQERENDEVLEGLEVSTEALLRQVERALARMSQGLYGTCEVCGMAIGPTRLLAMPQVTRCVSCAGLDSVRSRHGVFSGGSPAIQPD